MQKNLFFEINKEIGDIFLLLYTYILLSHVRDLVRNISAVPHFSLSLSLFIIYCLFLYTFISCIFAFGGRRRDIRCYKEREKKEAWRTNSSARSTQCQVTAVVPNWSRNDGQSFQRPGSLGARSLLAGASPSRAIINERLGASVLAMACHQFTDSEKREWHHTHSQTHIVTPPTQAGKETDAFRAPLVRFGHFFLVRSSAAYIGRISFSWATQFLKSSYLFLKFSILLLNFFCW